MKNSEKINTKVTPEVKDKLVKKAKQEGRTFSGHLRFVLESSVKEVKK